MVYWLNEKIIVESSIKDIESITKLSSFPLSENRMQWMTTDAFFHFDIKIKNWDSIKITSLISDDKLNIKGFKMIEDKKLITLFL